MQLLEEKIGSFENMGEDIVEKAFKEKKCNQNNRSKVIKIG